MALDRVKFSTNDFQKYLKETLGASATLVDGKKGLKGIADPGDVLVYKNSKGKVVKTTLGETRFEQGQLQLAIVKAAKDFWNAGVDFSGKWNTDRVNDQFWWKNYSGKMGVRMGQSPSEAITDIFKHGDKYAFECATATMVILHKAILDVVGPKDFDAKFDHFKLFRWQIKDADFLAAEKVGQLPGYQPGDHTYFKNPQFDPSNSAFQGENVIYLGDGQYFGHGIGLVSEQELVNDLNDLRAPNATKSAYRDNFELRLNAKKLAKLDISAD